MLFDRAGRQSGVLRDTRLRLMRLMLGMRQVPRGCPLLQRHEVSLEVGELLACNLHVPAVFGTLFQCREHEAHLRLAVQVRADALVPEVRQATEPAELVASDLECAPAALVDIATGTAGVGIGRWRVHRLFGYGDALEGRLGLPRRVGLSARMNHTLRPVKLHSGFVSNFIGRYFRLVIVIVTVLLRLKVCILIVHEMSELRFDGVRLVVHILEELVRSSTTAPTLPCADACPDRAAQPSLLLPPEPGAHARP